MQMMIIYCILEIDKHEHKRLILRFKPHVFCCCLKIRCSSCHKLVGYKVLINVFMASSMFPCLYLNTIFEPILILLQFSKASIL